MVLALKKNTTIKYLKYFKDSWKGKYVEQELVLYCKKIVENHNGEITVKSKLNKGTTFDIFYPKKTNGKSNFFVFFADDDARPTENRSGFAQ
jgi:light-regulated signal transduction histidine kinase (bacteriophytochrome)